jgi:hypothetical protein
MSIFLLSCLISTNSVVAETCSVNIENFSIETVGNGMDIKAVISGEFTLEIPFITIGGQPRLEGFEKSDNRPDLWEATYYAGMAGTSYMVSEYRKAIIDPCGQKVLVDAAYRVVPQDEEDKVKWRQPQWRWGINTLYIFEDGYNPVSISLPKEKLKGSYQFYDYKVPFNPDQNWKELSIAPFKDHHHPDEIKAAAKAAEIPNFAGHFKLMYFGCGTGCSGLGFMDKESGALFEPDFVVHRGFNQDARMINYRVDSALIIVNGALSEGGEVGTYYFRFDGKNFIQLD